MRMILQARGALPAEPTRPAPVQIVTPYNLPVETGAIATRQ
jgi:LacI family transcriptional regulator